MIGIPLALCSDYVRARNRWTVAVHSADGASQADAESLTRAEAALHLAAIQVVEGRMRPDSDGMDLRLRAAMAEFATVGGSPRGVG